jgi:hypothetical protein
VLTGIRTLIMETRSVSETPAAVSHQLDCVEPYCGDTPTHVSVCLSVPTISVAFSLYTVHLFYLSAFSPVPSGSVVSLLFSSFFYFSVHFFRFVCLSLPHFASFHYHSFFVINWLNLLRLHSVSHADCDYMTYGMTRRVVWYTSNNVSGRSATSIIRVYQ